MIWLIGGTKDSRDFISFLKEKGVALNNFIISVATEYGKKLIEELQEDEKRINIVSKPMNCEEMLTFVECNKITKIWDFSHPYAIEVSKNAIDVAKLKRIEYIRYERENLEGRIEFEKSYEFYNIKDLVNFTGSLKENVLVTLGSNNISEFKGLGNLEKIYFRVLPVTISLKKLEDNGIKAKNIIGLQGPFSKEFNGAIYKNYGIKYMVTKESGLTGGELEKLLAAKELGVIPIILKRPRIKYPKMVKNFTSFIEE